MAKARRKKLSSPEASADTPVEHATESPDAGIVLPPADTKPVHEHPIRDEAHHSPTVADPTPPEARVEPPRHSDRSEPHAHAARHQNPSGEHDHASRQSHHRESEQSHAAAVGKREFKPSPDPFGIAGDYVAGVRLLESKKYREMVLKFEERPSEDVISKLKDAGYRYNAPSKAWTHGLNQDNAMTVRIDAEKLFHEVAGMIRNERGVNHGYGGRS